MNYQFKTGAERVAVLEALRTREIVFPPNWESKQRQRESARFLSVSLSTFLNHSMDSNHGSAPARSRSETRRARAVSKPSFASSRSRRVFQRNPSPNEYVELIIWSTISHYGSAKPDSPHYEAVISALFSQPYSPVRASLYDAEAARHDYMTLSGVVEDQLKNIFTRHGAVNMEPPLLMPSTRLYSDDHSPVTFLDRQGDLVTLARNALVPFARMAARSNIQRIKRFHIGSIFKQGVLGGHPETLKAAVFDIITPDLAQGTAAAAAEAIALVSECINSFPGLGAAQYEISITHSKCATFQV
jgi:translation initiation factor 2-alpha kinase 4